MQKELLTVLPAWLRPWIASSKNQAQISLTLKALIPLVLFLMGWFGIESNSDQLNEIVEKFAENVTLIGAAISGVVTFWGLLRKFFKKPQAEEPTGKVPQPPINDDRPPQS